MAQSMYEKWRKDDWNHKPGGDCQHDCPLSHCG
jgi:hypothetical protein